MKGDERIEKLLTGLGATTPGAGFEQRVLRGVEARRSAQSENRRGAPWGWRLAGSAICAGLLAIAVLHEKSPVRPVPSPRDASIAPVAGISDEATNIREGPSLARGRMEVARRVRVPVASVMQGAAEASFPAPPMPLTEQERLLRRIAHTGDVQEFATLNAEARKREEALQVAAYEAYFAPPPLTQDALETIRLQKIGESQ